ncbi:MAG: SidA/IucD/PvdA family monooxygenase [Gammaproteobacteria bacterium]|nr:SidA/IucD/PvdA family monooxygenase [Gammaproteobacteria bacterium]
MAENKIYSLIGIGLGPANLSLSALLGDDLRSGTLFLERQAKFNWHSDMMFRFSRINVGFQKDLVSLVDPTNPYSFMNYLVKHHKQYAFFNAAQTRVSRLEFEDYYRWAAKSMSNIEYNRSVSSITFSPEADIFKIISGGKSYYTKTIVIGTGIKPKFPSWYENIGDNLSICHCYNYLKNKNRAKKKRLLIIGGGQSSAEILFDILQDDANMPEHIYWVSTKGYPVMLDENPFANEVYTPTFSQSFYKLSDKKRQQLNTVLGDTSDGIHQSLLEKIYQRLYCVRFIMHVDIKLTFIPLSKVADLQVSEQLSDGVQYRVSIEGAGEQVIDNIGYIIFCTGYSYNADDLLPGLQNYYGQKIEINQDFSIQPLNQVTSCKLFLNNGAKAFYGPADPNISLMTWRNAVIINSAFNMQAYNLHESTELVSWEVSHAKASVTDNSKILEFANEHRF